MKKWIVTIGMVVGVGMMWFTAQGQIMLPTACIDEEYFEEVSLVLDESYNINGTIIILDGASIESVTGLPDGLSWYCSPCVGQPGEEIRVYITGTPTVDNSLGLFNLDFSGIVTVNGADFLVDFPYGGTVGDTYAMELDDCSDTNCFIPIDATTQSASCIDACDGSATVFPDRGVEPYEYRWASGATGPTITDVCSGIYFVTVTDATGCESSTSVNVAFEPDECEVPCEGLLFLYAQKASCPEECDATISVEIENGTPPYRYQWGENANNQTTSSLSDLCPGFYRLTVTDANDCEMTESIIVGTQEAVCESPVCEVSTEITVSELNCVTDCNGQAQITPTGGTAPYSFQWDAAAGSQTTATANNLCAGIYQVTTTDAVGCTVIDTITVDASSELTVHALLSAVKPDDCRRKGIVLVQGYRGQAPYTYQWSNGMTSNRLDSLPMGMPSVTVTDAAGCSITRIFPNEGQKKDDYCDLITFVRNNTTTTRYTFQVPETINTGQWTIEGGIFPGVIELNEAPSLTYTFTVEGTYTVCYTFQNAEGCEIQCCKNVQIERIVADCNLTTIENMERDVFEFSMPGISEVAWLHGDSIILNPVLELPVQDDCISQPLLAVYLEASGEYYRFCESEISLCPGANLNTEVHGLQTVDRRPSIRLDNYPNPWSSQTTIRLHSPEATSGRLQVLDANGQVVMQKSLTITVGEQSVQIERALPPGIYVYRLITPSFSESAVMSVVR